MSYTTAWLRAFALTAAIEVPVVVALTRDGTADWRRRASLALLGQAITHPLVWFVFPFIPGITGHTALTLSELWAWLGEAALYALAGLTPGVLRAIGISGLSNGLSLGIGYLLLS